MTDQPPQDWAAPRVRGPLHATVRLPGSKSLTNRFLILAALANDRSVIRRPLRSRDTLLMADALRSLGVLIEDVGAAEATSALKAGPGARPPRGTLAGWLVTPPQTLRGGVGIHVGLAGTVMRFLPPVAALADGPVDFDGDPGSRVRPIGPLLGALRELGVKVADQSRNALPFTVKGKGRVTGGVATFDASASSQFVSALLLAGARYDEGVTIRHRGKPMPSEPHIAMTVETLRDVGVIVDDDDANLWRVEPSEINALDVKVEPDLSSAGPFVAAALVAGGTVTIPGWPRHTTQGGDALRQLLSDMGADVRLSRSGLTVTGTGAIAGIDIDLHDASELTPVVAALAALADTPSRIRGVAHIRGHETDRIRALSTEINRLGGKVSETEDGLRIQPARLKGRRFRTYHDHRMAMAGAVLGLRVRDLVVEDIATTAKTLPGFTELWMAMLDGTG